MKKAIINFGSVTGSHDKMYGGQVNQDSYCFKTVGDYVCAVISDGAGSHKYADIGAKTFSQNVCEYLANNVERIYLQDTDLTRQEIANVIRETSKRLVTENGGAERDYGSTLLFAVLKVGSTDVLYGNLGDGELLIDFSDECKDNPQTWFNVLSFPVRKGNGTYLTNSMGFDTEFRVERDGRRGTPDGYKKIWLITDGVWGHIFAPNHGLDGKSVDEAVNKIYEEPPVDDATFISIEW